ncbi:regulatory protein NPR4 [Physcomitrium patens]|uniref:BTB domain-containing protein n=1 Tax=Physcomitrium patens TaxID=3218 RepID=A0A7I4CBL8_PHYPA|nr:regulatory protein NPR4-like isoform X1 [Physcomitrium patens]|eukprot:XP_024359583.1 regulatory protein NPR4-like isoform X1 [Physcomitrella patens]
MSDLSLALPVHDTTPGGVTPASFQELCSDLETLIQMPDEEYSDLNIIVEGEYVPVHRCILAARCSGLRKVLAGIVRNGKSKLELELNTITDKGKIGYEAFRAVMGYVYGGKMEPWPVVIACYDSSCAHLTCRPAINHVLEILYAAILLNLPELNTLAQQHLIDKLGKFQVEDMLHVYRSASAIECSQLQSVCLTTLASSKLDNLTVEKEFSGAALEEVRRMRMELGNGISHLAPLQEMQCKRIHRALDSDDVELVRLLLDEKKLDFDGAHGLHYAAAYCHPRTLAHLLELNLADPKLRNERGMTVLHVAAWRREPQAIGNLLDKSAQLKDLTPDNLSALDILRRLSRKSNVDREDTEKERLCITILEQAEKKHTLTVPQSAAAMLTMPSTEKELTSMLLYLENRVALGRLLYPREADIVMGISHLDSYAAFTGVHMKPPGSGIASRRRKPAVDLNEEPSKRLANLVAGAEDQSKEGRLESLRQRCDALRKAVEMGRRYFPCYSAVIDKYVLDDDYVEPNDEGNIEEKLMKKRHLAELKDILQDSFPKSKVDEHKMAERGMEKNKRPRMQDGSSSSSSSSSSRSTSGSMVTKR